MDDNKRAALKRQILFLVDKHRPTPDELKLLDEEEDGQGPAKKPRTEHRSADDNTNRNQDSNWDSKILIKFVALDDGPNQNLRIVYQRFRNEVRYAQYDFNPAPGQPFQKFPEFKFMPDLSDQFLYDKLSQTIFQDMPTLVLRTLHRNFNIVDSYFPKILLIWQFMDDGNPGPYLSRRCPDHPPLPPY